eukprot:SAG11_NODE_26494_length_344_cov_1.057143_2_plen_74_part_01
MWFECPAVHTVANQASVLSTTLQVRELLSKEQGIASMGLRWLRTGAYIVEEDVALEALGIVAGDSLTLEPFVTV